ncbi:MAG: hypothetical protein FGM14_16690 [Flavobacteriales bacterium]|nr:hypothetical protein [Flavobacteriales bacterium]
MKNYILMCDIIGSRNLDQVVTIEQFKKCTSHINKKYANSLLSPLTITLGDEFQGIVQNLNDSIQILIDLEEFIIENNFKFKLRYVVNYGKIETKINNKIAYEMLGEGLTNARIIMNELKNSSHRFNFIIDNLEKEIIINNSFIIFQNIIDNWNINKDNQLISNFLKFKDYKIVAEKMNKERSLIWKREKSLNLASYNSSKIILQTISKQ